jgi:hypothetical protein
VIYRKILKTEDIIKLQRDVDRLGEWAVENEMKINPNKSKAVCFTRAREERNVQNTVTRIKANWIIHILRRTYPLKYVIERKV